MRIAFFTCCIACFNVRHIARNTAISLFNSANELRANDKSAIKIMIKYALHFLGYLSSLTSIYISNSAVFKL